MCLSLTRVSISGSDCSPEPLSSYEDPSSSINSCDLRTYTFEFMAGDDGGEVLELLAEKLPAFSLRHDVIVGVRRQLRGTAAVDPLSVVDVIGVTEGEDERGRRRRAGIGRRVGLSMDAVMKLPLLRNPFLSFNNVRARARAALAGQRRVNALRRR
nr:hypothetical protein Itr_chr11CG07460 [Ipomoea trifida]